MNKTQHQSQNPAGLAACFHTARTVRFPSFVMTTLGQPTRTTCQWRRNMIRIETLRPSRRFFTAAVAGLFLFASNPGSTHAEVESSILPKEIIGKDGVPMVLVPAGEFLMGVPETAKGFGVRENQKPQHTVSLDAFYIDKYEMTNSLYAKYVEANGGGEMEPAYYPTNKRRLDMSIHGNTPVTSIMWKSARGYCEWAGKRLPTEAEWEKAARGTDGRKYPWGNEEPTSEHAVFGTRPHEWKGPNSLSRVDSHPKGASPYGAHHMAGNAFEWVNDLYLEEYYKESPAYNPQGPPRGTKNRHGKQLSSYSVRGGSARSSTPVIVSTFRAGWSHIYIPPHGGFRCAQSAGTTGATDDYKEGRQ